MEAKLTGLQVSNFVLIIILLLIVLFLGGVLIWQHFYYRQHLDEVGERLVRLEQTQDSQEVRLDGFTEKASSLLGAVVQTQEQVSSGFNRFDRNAGEQMQRMELILDRQGRVSSQLSDVSRSMKTMEAEISRRIKTMEKVTGNLSASLQQFQGQQKRRQASDKQWDPERVRIEVDNPEGDSGWKDEYEFWLRPAFDLHENYGLRGWKPFAVEASEEKPEGFPELPEFKHDMQRFLTFELGNTKENVFYGVADFDKPEEEYFPFDLYVDTDRDGEFEEIGKLEERDGNGRPDTFRMWVPYKDDDSDQYAIWLWSYLKKGPGDPSFSYFVKSARYALFRANKKVIQVLVMDNTGNGIFNDESDRIVLDWDLDGMIECEDRNGMRPLYEPFGIGGEVYRVTECDPRGRRMVIRKQGEQTLSAQIRDDGERAGHNADTQILCPQTERMDSEIARALAYSSDWPQLTSNVVIGRLILDGYGDVQRDIKTQMDIWPDGYFVALVGEKDKPLSFRAHGCYPLDISLGLDKPLDLGIIRMRRVPPAKQARLTGVLNFEGGGVPSQVVATADIVQKKNTPGNHAADRYGRYKNTNYQGHPIPLEVTADGELRGSGFSPAEYELTVSAEGYVTKSMPIQFRAGETLDFGTLNIERPKIIHLVYTGSGLDGKRLSTTLAPDEAWRPPLNGSWKLSFEQEAGQLRLDSGYGPWYGSDLGTGKLADFAGIEETEVSPQRYPRFNIRNGHVYFIKMYRGEWLCFEARIEGSRVDSDDAFSSANVDVRQEEKGRKSAQIRADDEMAKRLSPVSRATDTKSFFSREPDRFSTGGNHLLVSYTEPVSPAKLDPGEKLHIKIQYQLGSAESVQIFARPYTNGEKTPGYAAHPSSIYRKSEKAFGEAEGWFRFGKPSYVNQIKVKMVETKTGEAVCITSLPVNFQWGEYGDTMTTMKAVDTDTDEIQQGQPFPELRFESLSGEIVDIGELKGKVVLLDFWAVWCGPCVHEMPEIVSLYRQYHDDGFEIIGISLDQNRDKLESYLRDNQITWPQYFDGKGWNNDIARRFGVRGIPTTVLLDKAGVVQFLNLHGSELLNTVAGLLGQQDYSPLLPSNPPPSYSSPSVR
ncbi:TlpA family protein disulfide reductase [Planctomycetota bacterium]